jgi:hypothetical protein
MTHKNVVKVSGMLILIILGAALAAAYFPEGPPAINVHPGPPGPPTGPLSPLLGQGILIGAILLAGVVSAALHIGSVILCFIVLLKALKYLNILLEREERENRGLHS